MISDGATEILEEWKSLAREYAAEIQRGDAKCRELQNELNEQCRLLGMSAERELTLNTQIQHLINERNAFGLAIDRALAGIVPDEHPLRSRLVEIAALHAKFETMRKQEPVGEVYHSGCDATGRPWHDMEWYDDDVIVPAGSKLYLAPGAQTAPSVPAPIEGAKYMSNDWYYAEGWNDCRHAMLDAQTAPSVPDGWQPIETAPKDGTHVLLTNKTGTRVADGMYGNYKVWSWPYVMVEPAYWRPMPAAPGAQENNDADL